MPRDVKTPSETPAAPQEAESTERIVVPMARTPWLLAAMVALLWVLVYSRLSVASGCRFRM